jgi:DNA-binding GntR family transcriptional regulator
MKAAADAKDLMAHMAADMRFHGLVYERSGSEVLAGTWAGIESTIRKFIRMAAPLYVGDLHEASEGGPGTNGHLVLLEALAAGDLDTLSDEVPAHLTNLWKRMRSA